jgi:hypothetical protein
MLTYIIISIIVLLVVGVGGFIVLKPPNNNSNSKPLPPKPLPPKPPAKPKPQCDISKVKCGSTNCCDTKTETCFVESSECCQNDETYKSNDGKSTFCCEDPNKCVGDKCCDKTKICKDKSTKLDIYCDEKNTVCINGECCTNICTDKNGGKSCCKTDEMCFNHECLNPNDLTTCTTKNEAGYSIITDSCIQGVTACVGSHCCDSDNICSYAGKDDKVICCNKDPDFSCITTAADSKICCYKDNICTGDNGSTCCKNNETCIDGFCCNNQYKCSDNTKCCYTGKDLTSTLKCLKDQDICCDKNNTYKNNFGIESCCDGTIYKDKDSTKCCEQDTHKMVDGKCKLICGKEFCDTGFGEVCEDENHCINTKCKWNAIIYDPPLVDNKYEACSVADSDGIASLYRNPNYVEESELHRTVAVQANTLSKCLEKYCVQRLDEKGLTFLAFDEAKKCSGSFDCSKLPDFNSEKGMAIENAVTASHGSSACKVNGNFVGVVCTDKEQICSWDNQKFDCHYGFYNNNGKCEQRLEYSHNLTYDTIDECKAEIEKDKLQLAANCTFEPDNTVCSVCKKGYILMDGARTKCCPKMDGCPSGWYGKQNATSEDCGCGKCLQDHIPECLYYDTECKCTVCNQGYDLNGDHTKCCPKIDDCTEYNSDCKCSDCKPGYGLNQDGRGCSLTYTGWKVYNTGINTSCKRSTENGSYKTEEECIKASCHNNSVLESIYNRNIDPAKDGCCAPGFAYSINKNKCYGGLRSCHKGQCFQGGLPTADIPLNPTLEHLGCNHSTKKWVPYDNTPVTFPSSDPSCPPPDPI